MSEAYQPMLKGEEMDSVGLHYRGQSTILDVDKHFIMRRVRIHARYLRILGSMLLHPSVSLCDWYEEVNMVQYRHQNNWK